MVKLILRFGCFAFLILGGATKSVAVPNPPANLTSTALKATSFTLNWSVPAGGSSGISGYDIYQDGSLIGSTTTARTFPVSGLSPSVSYNMTVVARDTSNQTSAPSATLLVTTPTDTTKPSNPANLSATNITTTSCLLSWTVSTDDIGVSGYNIYRSGVLLGSVATGTSYPVTSLTPDTSNNLTVRAFDAAGNLSGAGTVLVVQTLADLPSIPAGLATTGLKDISFTLKWSASTGGTGGIVGYDIYENGVQIGTTTTARTFAVSGLSPNVTYNMTVAARDSVNQASAPSVVLAVTTTADTTNPSKPASVGVTNITTTSCSLSWNAATDDVEVIGYNIYRNSVLIGSTAATSFNVTNLGPDTINNLTVRATDVAGNLSPRSTVVVVQTLADPPSVPTGLTMANIRPASFTLRWAASTGGSGGISGYYVYLNGVVIGSPKSRSLAITGLTPATSYTLSVASYDGAGNVSASTAPLAVTTPADTTKPTVPAGLSADNVTANSFSFTWTNSTDNVAVIAYDVFRNGVLVGSTPNNFFQVSGLASSIISSMQVKARDAAGNASNLSAALTITTSAPPNIPPTIILSAPASGATFVLPATFTLTAVAADSDGTVTKVEFFDGTTKLGEVFPPSAFALSITITTSGIHTLVARATDDRNGTTDSVPVVVTVDNPNQAPTITLTADSTSLAAPGFVTLIATAADSDGTITKVQYYLGTTLLDELTVSTAFPSSYAFPITLYSVGTYSITAVATDNSGVQSTSTPLTINIGFGAANFPFVANFESAEGYNTGLLNGQLSWVATGGVAIIPSTTSGSARELSIPAAQPPESFSHDFSSLGVSPVFADFRARPVAGTDATNAVIFSTPAAQVALVGSHSPAELWIFGGGVGWYGTGMTIATDANGQTIDWIRLTTREDYLTKKWDLYLNGQMVSADLGFADAAANSLTNFSVTGHGAVSSAFDEFYAGAENPLFADVNHNGIEDGWEIAHGLSLSADNRQLSPAGNGLTVIQAYVQGTDPNDYYGGSAPTIAILSGNNQTGAFGQYNAQPFAVMVTAANSSPLVNAPITFTVHSGGGQLSSYNDGSDPLSTTVNVVTDASGVAQVYFQQPAATNTPSTIIATAGTAQVIFVSMSGLSTIGTPSDTDGNGIPDDWEMQNFGQINVDPVGDPDGDGFTNRQEYLMGTNPNDTFDGKDLVVNPVLTPLGELLPGGKFRVWVGRSDGVPLKNVTVQISMGDNNNLLTDAIGSTTSGSITVTTDANGIAEVFLTPNPEQPPPSNGGYG